MLKAVVAVAIGQVVTAIAVFVGFMGRYAALGARSNTGEPARVARTLPFFGVVGVLAGGRRGTR